MPWGYVCRAGTYQRSSGGYKKRVKMAGLGRRLLAAFLLGLLAHFPVVDLFALYPATYHAAKTDDDE